MTTILTDRQFYEVRVFFQTPERATAIVTLMDTGIRDILEISLKEDLPLLEKALGCSLEGFGLLPPGAIIWGDPTVFDATRLSFLVLENCYSIYLRRVPFSRSVEQFAQSEKVANFLNGLLATLAKVKYLNLILIGPSGAGKTGMLYRYMQGLAARKAVVIYVESIPELASWVEKAFGSFAYVYRLLPTGINQDPDKARQTLTSAIISARTVAPEAVILQEVYSSNVSPPGTVVISEEDIKSLTSSGIPVATTCHQSARLSGKDVLAFVSSHFGSGAVSKSVILLLETGGEFYAFFSVSPETSVLFASRKLGEEVVKIEKHSLLPPELLNFLS